MAQPTFTPEQAKQMAALAGRPNGPVVRGPMPIPPPPPSTEQWSFRNVRGTRETIRAAILGARLVDEDTRKPGDKPLPEPVVSYLLWILDNRKGEIFSLDGHVHSATEGEWLEHLHLRRWA